MLAAVDSCFGLIGPYQHGTANKQAQFMNAFKLYFEPQQKKPCFLL